MNLLHRCLVGAVALSLVVTSVPLRAAPAADSLVTTEEVLANSGAARDQIRGLLARAEVQAALAERGVTAGQVQARVDALTDAEARQLADQLESMPAGGTDVLGAIILILAVLFITDILCLTKVYPFTRCAAR